MYAEQKVRFTTTALVRLGNLGGHQVGSEEVGKFGIHVYGERLSGRDSIISTFGGNIEDPSGTLVDENVAKGDDHVP